MKKVWIFFPEMTLAQFPKSDFLNFRWIFFPKMTLAQFPVFGFFFQDSRIGVKEFSNFSDLFFDISRASVSGEIVLLPYFITHKP